MEMTITLTDEQLDVLADKLAERQARRRPSFQGPLSVSEFARLTGLSEPSVYRQVHAGQVRRVQGLAKILIPAAELERFR